jgi:peroxiredoxin
MTANIDPSADSIDAKIGSLAPNFKLKATNGREIELADFRGRKNVILFFVREYI